MVVNRLIAMMLLLTSSLYVNAQKVSEMTDLASKFKNEDVVQLNQFEELNIKINGEALSINSKIQEQSFIRNAKSYTAERKIGFNKDLSFIDQIEASTWIPKGDEYLKIKVKKIEETARLDNSVFYDDVVYKRFFFTGIEPNSITNLSYNISRNDPHIISPFYFSPYDFALVSSKYTVIIDSNIKISYHMYGDTRGIQENVQKVKDKIIYTWTLNNKSHTRDYNGIRSFRYIEPHIVVRVLTYKTKKQVYNVLRDVKDLYTYEYKNIDGLNSSEINPALKIVLDSIKRNCSDNTQLIKSVLYWVKDNVRYVAFEDGKGGVVPRQANDIFQKKFGDCKDYSSIIKCMLNYLNIDAYLTWVGTNELPYPYSLSVPFVSNHMIVAVPYKNDFIYLDGTSYNIKYDIPSGFIQGKEALIAINKDSFLVKTVPMVDGSRNRIKIVNQLKLINESKIKGTSYIESDGLLKADFLDDLYFEDSLERDIKIKRYISFGSNKCIIPSYTIRNDKNRDSTLYINANIELDDYIKKIDGKIYLNLNFNKYLSTSKIDTLDNRITSYYFKNLLNVLEHHEFEIPEGYKINKLPSSFKVENEFLKYEAFYAVVSNKVLYTIIYDAKKIEIPYADFEKWNKTLDGVFGNIRQLVVLEKK